MAANGKQAPWAQSDQKIAAQALKLIDKANREGPQRVIVGLDSGFVPEGRLAKAAAAFQRRAISVNQTSLMGALAGLNVLERRRFKHIPFVVLEADAHALERLAVLPMVASLQEDRAEAPLMASSNEVIGSPDAWAAGYEGTGWTVAVLDTGVDKTHPFFATRSKVVSEACYSSTAQPQFSSLCPGGVGASTASGSGLNCPLDVEGCHHGTHVAGSVAGDDQIGPNFGVARSSDIIAIQVFSRFDKGSCGPSANSPCALSYPSDQVAALERVYDLRDDFHIAAVNMSLGGSSYADEAECDANEGLRKAAIDNLLSVGIATVVASGNSNSRTSVSTPACISSAVSVGATTDSDSIASFSNTADFLDLLAPGTSIDSSVPGGSVSSSQGTSMATPHVAGAWAVLKQKSPAADVATILAALRDTGTSLDDQRSSGTVTDMRRINVDLALSEFSEPVPEFDSTPPAGSLFDFGLVAIGTTSDSFVLLVHNPGNAELTLSCSLGGESSAIFSIGDCPSPVAGGQSAEVHFDCQPQAAGAHTAVLYLDTNDPDEAQLSYDLNCQSLLPEFASDPVAGSNFDFGQVPVNSASENQTVQVQNLGDGPLTLDCSLSGDGAPSFAISACPGSVAPLATVDIYFHCAADAAGNKSASLDLITNDPDENRVNFNLACIGTAAEFDSTPAPGSELDFGEVQIGTVSDSNFVQVENLGDAELTMDCMISGDGAAVFELIQCPASVGAATSGQIEVNCQPWIVGDYLASLDLVTNDGDESGVNFGLLCTGSPDTIFTDGYETEMTTAQTHP